MIFDHTPVGLVGKRHGDRLMIPINNYVEQPDV